MGGVTPEFLAAVSAHTGVPESLLSGDTTEAVWDRAQRLADWKATTAAAPPTAAVPAASPLPVPITPQQLVPGDDWMSAYRSGCLADFGAPAPQPHGPRSSRGMPW